MNKESRQLWDILKVYLSNIFEIKINYYWKFLKVKIMVVLDYSSYNQDVMVEHGSYSLKIVISLTIFSLDCQNPYNF
jgi:hypothetical protein